jgi:GH15 family glucan-1,4-alpha-glucosidase
MRKAPESRWRRAREEIREAVETEGYDERRGVFVQAFGETQMDAALLRLPTVGFVDYADERMVRTVDAIREDLEDDRLVWRYRGEDGLEGEEGAFLACSFWLVEVMARQGRHEEARAIFDRALSTANGLGLFSEEYDPDAREMLGNFPQALSHLSHIEAALALAEHTRPPATAEDRRLDA